MTASATVDLQETPQGIVLAVRAQPGARRNAITGIHAAALKVAVTAAPEKGKANDAIVALLCERLDLARSQVEIVAGDASRQKKLRIAGIAAAELRRRIAKCLDE
jgi:uncharacterized protein (TIGR00251 family)